MIELKLRVGRLRFQADLWRSSPDTDGEAPDLEPTDCPPHTVGGAQIGFSSHPEPGELTARSGR